MQSHQQLKRPRSQAEAQDAFRCVPAKRQMTSAHFQMQRGISDMGPPPAPPNSDIDSIVDHGNGAFSAHPEADISLGPLPAPDLRTQNYSPFFNNTENFFHLAQTPLTRSGAADGYQSVDLNAYPDPWDPQGIGRANGRGTTQPLMNPTHSGARERARHDSATTRYYVSQGSDLDSSITGQQQPDSGYETRSFYSGEIFGSNHDCQSMTGRLDEIEISRAQQQAFKDANPFGDYPIAQGSQHGQTVIELAPDLECEIFGCDYVFKNPSDAKKHKLRHDKPFTCQEPNCTRKKGFTTLNDLTRHQNSLHEPTGKSWKCAAPHCAKREKRWPRADNFRQHIKRLHPDLEVNKLMEDSENLASRLDGENKVGQAPQSSQRTSQYLDDFPQQKLVVPHDLTMIPSINVLMNSCSREILPQYPVGTARNSTHMSTSSSQGTKSSLVVDSRVPRSDQAGKDSTAGAVLRSRDQILNVSKVPLVRRPPMSQPKMTVIHNTKNAATVLEKLSAFSHGIKRSDHSSFAQIAENEAPDPVAVAASDIARHFKGSIDPSSEDIELVIRTRMLPLMDLKKTEKSSTPLSPQQESSDPEKPFKCPHAPCKKRKKAKCELKKHVKRHTRPYGCTESSCTKRFGSKNDWKRHENSQHFRVEAWKCAEAKLSVLNTNNNFSNKSNHHPTKSPRKVHSKSKNKEKCNRVLYRREQFQAHLETEHKHKDNQEYVSEQCRNQRIGRNGQKAFWCGFCQKVVQLQKRGLEAWDERFTHIDAEHFQRGESVDNWFTMNEDIPKSVLAEEKKDDSEEERNESEESGWSDDEDEDGISPPNSNPSSPLAQPTMAIHVVNGEQKSHRQGPLPGTDLSRNNQAGKAQPHNSDSWYCRNCATGPYSRNLNTHCPTCCHQRHL